MKRVAYAFLALSSFCFPAVSQTGSGNGPSVCNCTGAPILGASINHVARVKVSVGGTELMGNYGTTQSGSAFTNQMIGAGMCLYVQYNFDCTQLESGNWDCQFTGDSLQERDAVTPGDC